MAGSSTPICEHFACLSPYLTLGQCGVGAVGELFDSCGKYLQGFPDTLGPCF
jgi:hypothetical protein